MNAAMEVDVRQLERALRALPGALPNRVVQHGLKAAADTARVKAKSPGFAFNDRTGLARRSIRSRAVTKRYSKHSLRQGKAVYATLGIGSSSAWYGRLLELGTSRAKARAPVRRAVEESVGEMWRAATTAMRRKMGALAEGKLNRADVRAAGE